MTRIALPFHFAGVNVADVLARNWTQDSDGDQRRMGNRVAALRAIAQATNYGLARVPQIIATNAVSGSLAYDSATSLDPLWQFRYLDNIKNGKVRLLHVLALPRTAGSGDCQAYRTGDTNDTTGVVETSTTVAASATYPTDLQHYIIRHDRGVTPGDALENVGLTAANGFTVCALTVQDESLESLDTDFQLFAPIGTPGAGDKCVETFVEDVRAVIQALREQTMPVLASWCANLTAGATGFVVGSDVTTYTNFLDGSSTTRTAVTPGINCHVQYAGHGPISGTAGRRVKVVGSVLAYCSDTDGDVQIEGSSTHSSNTDSVAVSGSTPTWYDFSSGIYLDSGTADGTVTTARNKIDVFGKVDSTGDICLLGWYFREEHI